MKIEKKIEKTVTMTDYMDIYLCDRCGEECGADRREMALSYTAFDINQYHYHRECRDKVLADIMIRDWPLVQERTVLDEEGEDIHHIRLCGMCGGEIDRSMLEMEWDFFPYVPGHRVGICKGCARSIRPMLRDGSKMPEGAVE